MLVIDDDILFLIRYPMQSDLLPLVVCGQHVVEGHDCHILADILCGNRVLVAGIADEAIFLRARYYSFVDDIFAFERAHILFFQSFKGNLVDSGMNLSVDFVTPG